MLRKLKIKFIVVIMSIVTIMLGVIFGLLYYSTSRNLERESLQMMGSIAMNPMKIAPPDGRREDVGLPYFSVIISRTGDTSGIGGGFFDLSDSEMLQAILQTTYEIRTRTGVLKEYGLRFLRTDIPNGDECIVFADISSERSTLHNLIKTSLITGAAVLIAFFGISILLARWAVKPVEQAWAQQKQFVADASHELKTPLTVIMTDAELINSAQCSESERKQLSDSIITMSGQMRGLVESMLELARIDNGSRQKNVEKISLSETASVSAMLFEPLFFEKGMTFSYDVEPEIAVSGDASQLKQLIEILLDNASKYASPGGNTTLTLKQTSKKCCILTAANEGEPISSTVMENIFKRFYRADTARAMNHSYGLGLSIAKSIVDEHHGKIWAESKDGVNSFYVELPTV